MKKLFALVLAMVMVSSVAMTSMAEEKPLIGLGDYNEDVIRLPQKLSELGLYGLRAESPWGPESVESISLLQDLLGLEETGNVK